LSSVLLFFRLETRGILIDLMDANIPILELPAVCVDSGIEREALWDTGGGSLLSGGSHIGKSSLVTNKDRDGSGNNRIPPWRGVFGW
jgi:hypothetical protein